MKNSDELFDEAIHSVELATGCTQTRARLLVGAIACYISRFNAEMYAKSGPAWDQYLASTDEEKSTVAKKEEHNPESSNCVRHFGRGGEGHCPVCGRYDNAVWLTQREREEFRRQHGG